MGKPLLVLAIIAAIVGCGASLYLFKELRSLKYKAGEMEKALEESSASINTLTDMIDRKVAHRAVFLHHSVGRGIMNQGGLRDSMLDMGILVRGATYGDEIGEETDICDWAPKFEKDIDRIFSFKAHPNQYYGDNTQNDIVIFKSCYPNSNIGLADAASKVPAERQKTMDNYTAWFKDIAKVFQKHPTKLFVYLTAPPLAPERTTPENAARARQFNQWLQNEFIPAYQQETGLRNFVVYDLFDQLANPENLLAEQYRTERPGDSHPNVTGYQAAASGFIRFFQPVWAQFYASALAQQPQAVK